MVAAFLAAVIPGVALPAKASSTGAMANAAAIQPINTECDAIQNAIIPARRLRKAACAPLSADPVVHG
jgi:hypothetical protein